MEYQLELKQIVSYPRCRIYRDFVRTLMDDKSIRLGGCSFFSLYIILCSYVNYTTHSVGYDGIKYSCHPGEWVCKLSDMAAWFRVRSGRQVLKSLDVLQDAGFITYARLGRGKLVKFKISDWNKSNRIIEDYAPCQKDNGFFFLPIYKAHELISITKCTEMDIILDLWVHAVYNDPHVDGSELGPVVYYRDLSSNPLQSYSALAERWGLSKSTVCRILNKMDGLGYLKLVTYPGRHGTVIYLCQYLSTMFGISDVRIDKDELALALNITVDCPPQPEEAPDVSVPDDDGIVPKIYLYPIVEKVQNVLSLQGFSCAQCPSSSYILSSLSACKGKYMLKMQCKAGGVSELFELTIEARSPVSPGCKKHDGKAVFDGEVPK